MSKATVSNAKRAIATKGTPHVAKNTAPDMCLDPAVKVPKPFPNKAPTKLLGAGQTTKTKIANKPIWTEKGKVGPMTLDAHPPEVISASTMAPYRDVAEPTTVSGNVIVEGAGVVRSNDLTTQNKKNTVGIVDGSALGDGGLSEMGFLDLKCSLQKLTGINTAGKSSRQLGWPGMPQKGKERYYLEILTGTTVDFTCVRLDITESPNKPAACDQGGNHAKWTATRKGGGAESQTVTGVGDKFTVAKALTTPRKWTTLMPEGSGKVVDSPTTTNLGGGREATTTGKAGVGNAISSLTAAYEYWKLMKSPCVITVQAEACSGQKNAELKLFPAQKVDLSVDLSVEDESGYADSAAKAASKRVRDSLKQVTKISDYVGKICKLAGYNFKLKVFVGAKFSLKIEYKECTELKAAPSGKIYTESHVGRAWSVTAAASPLIGFGFEIPFSLLNLVLPAIGEGAAAVLRKLGVKVDVVFSASLSFGFEVTVGRDEYEQPSSTGSKFSILPEFGIALQIKAGIDLIALGVTFPGTISAGLYLGDKNDVLLQAVFSGQIKTKLFLTVFKDVRFIEHTWPAEPEDWKIGFDGKRVDLIPMP